MKNLKISNNRPSSIKINKLRPDDLDVYLEISFDAFFEKLKFITGPKKEEAISIKRVEISRNINNGRFYTAILENTVIGVIELITRGNIKTYKRNFRTYAENLGFLKGCRAFILTLISSAIENPRLNPGIIYIDNVAVEKNSRKKGVCWKMLSFAEDFARKNSMDALTLWVAAKNEIAHNLYKKFGFNDVVKRSSRIAESRLGYRDWIYMKKEIS